MKKFLESADVARALGLTPAGVRVLARAGRLRVTAVTPRGGRLFRPAEVEALRRVREVAREAGRKRGA
ncbi:MAG: MerR family transcriptional regulator [Candidatus Rokubacteria bacterium]|nr:MerR family transcriptional regulator [Candidatus Rokubacteria bacterium]